MMMTNGFGAYFGTVISSWLIGKYFVEGGTTNWHGAWVVFAVYSLIVAILFAIFFKHKHYPNQIGEIKH